jgi:hypothetical protein
MYGQIDHAEKYEVPKDQLTVFPPWNRLVLGIIVQLHKSRRSVFRRQIPSLVGSFLKTSPFPPIHSSAQTLAH